MQALSLRDFFENPIQQFSLWYDAALACDEIAYPNAFCLSTIDLKGFPDGRMLLLKDFNADGFVFYTNSLSVKGLSLEKIPKGGITFYWDPLGRQVRIQGTVTIVDAREADEYFSSRSRESQIGAWASEQSRELKDKQTLDQQVIELTTQYQNADIPRPPYWNGYRLAPHKIEFWQFGENRLHSRFEYRYDAEAWTVRLLFP